MSETCVEGVWKVSETCLEGQDWTCVAPFGPGRYLVVSECCLDCLDFVWRVFGKCM